jgi:hypothetical protein
MSVMTKPVIKRHGRVIRPENRSFLPGLIIQYSTFQDLIIRYQIRAIEGILYRKVFRSSADVEKAAASAVPPENEPAEPEKNRIMYRMRISIYIPIFSFLVLFRLLILYYNYNLGNDHQETR